MKITRNAEALEDIVSATQKMKDPEFVLNNVMPHMANNAYHKDLDLISEDYLDMKIVYKVTTDKTEDKRTNAVIGSGLLKELNISKDKIIDNAWHNLEMSGNATLYTMNDQMLSLIQGTEPANLLDPHGALALEKEMMYVLTAENKDCGATVITRIDMLLDIAKNILKEDFYILPSSVFEVILVPLSVATTTEELRKIVTYVNKETVEEKEQLSNNVYIFTRESRRVRIA